jgi:hypothetical protein
MKKTFFTRGCSCKLARTTLIFVSFAAVSSTMSHAGAPEVETTETPTESEPLENWAEFTVGGFAVSGDDAAFQSRYGNNGDFYGGIESFHFEKLLESGTFSVDGHALFGLEDYEVDLAYVRDDLGFIRAGYSEYRTWYDGSGGFLPGAGTPAGWDDPITLSDDALELDRGKLWFEAGLRMENLPAVTFGYEHRWRNGEKDSTIWGRELGPKGVEPAFYDIDETSDIFLLDVDYTIQNTDLALSLRYQMDDNDNSRRTVTEAEPSAVDVWDTDLFSSSLSSQTRLNDQMLLSFGYLFTTLDTDVDGTIHDTVNAISGGSQFGQHVANCSFWWNPIGDLVVVPSFRSEWQDIEATTSGPGAGNSTTGVQDSDTDVFETTEELELRYTGLSNVVLYARGEWSQSDKDLVIFEGGRNTRWSDIETDASKYVLGANYYPVSGLSLSTQYYYRNLDQDFRNSYDDLTDPSLDGQLYGHAMDTHNANIRVTWRALSCLTFVTRYDYQKATIENEAFWNLGDVNNPRITDSIDSAEITRHILSESVTWNATDRFYLQGSFSWVSSETDTPANERDHTTNTNGASVDPSFIPDWDNDYIVASLNAGYAVSKNTSLIFGCSYYGADNYLDNSSVAVPYGTDSDEYALTLTLLQQINANMVWNLRYGYFEGEDNADGGYNDYDAHMVSTGLQIRF